MKQKLFWMKVDIKVNGTREVTEIKNREIGLIYKDCFNIMVIEINYFVQFQVTSIRFQKSRNSYFFV